jgi:hypothetical protein
MKTVLEVLMVRRSTMLGQRYLVSGTIDIYVDFK